MNYICLDLSKHISKEEEYNNLSLGKLCKTDKKNPTKQISMKCVKYSSIVRREGVPISFYLKIGHDSPFELFFFFLWVPSELV